MQAGPKRPADDSPLPWRPLRKGAARFAACCRRFIRVPKGTGALQPLVLRDWQIGLVGSVLDADPQPRIAGWCPAQRSREIHSGGRSRPVRADVRR